MRKILLLLAVMCGSSLLAQLGFKVSMIRPTGDFGATMKPAIGGELVYKSFADDEDDSGFSLRASIGFAKFRPRLDTFPTLGVIASQGTTVTPGYTVIQKYNIITLHGGFDYHINLVDQALFLYPGIDVGAIFSSVDYTSRAPLISDEGYSGGYVYFSARLRAGLELLITENIGLFAEYTRSMNYSPEVGGLGYNDYGIGMRFNF